MGYFNYFIKCIIRNIAYKLCKPKVFLTVLLSIIILFVLHSYGYCSDWTDGEIEACLDGLATITSNQGVIISQLSSMGIDVTNIKQNLDDINSKLADINSSTANINSKLSTLISDVENLNANILNIYNQLDENHKELLSELEEDNQTVLNELTLIRESLNGTEDELTSYSDLGIITNSSSNVQYTLKGISINYQPKYTYKIKIYYNNPFRWSYACWCFCY